MIPNEVNEENSRNNFVQLRLGEIEKQQEPIFEEVVKQPLKKERKVPDLCEKNRDFLEKYHQHLNLNYRKKTTIQNYYYHVRKFLQWMNKPISEVTKDDMLNWRGYLLHTYMKNGNARRVASANHFTKWLGREDLKIPVPAQEHSNKIVLSEQELNDYLEESKDNPFWHVIALFQIDGLLRPSEFSSIKLSNLDLDNQTLYLDDTKTGNNYIILSPRLMQAIKEYLLYRDPKPDYEDYLIIIPNGTYKGKVPKPFGRFINKTTKQIAQKAGITKYVAPYIIKPSSITLDFNKNVNPKIIQRKARHRKVETTLRYDHVSDDMVRKYFAKQQISSIPIDVKITSREKLDDGICYI
ncbi:site-specific integrase [Patescibacteria group bacterium]|nr:site-specific integrase [Patescibacteria group bacterium]